ncbi:MAG: FGGY-family carbohydrate kinase [Eubacteriales bacterium]|nr:FGGY-family carbohydrate kinase [Eubacteriales bacterium]
MTAERKTAIGELIQKGEAVLGIELGSTRIKAVLIDEQAQVLATGVHDWENAYVDGIWTYDLADVRSGLQNCYRSLATAVQDNYKVSLTKLKAMGISAMMHGYLALDDRGRLLAPFRTWRNTNTTQAAEVLSERFDFSIPLRWSVAHLYQQMLEGAEHIHHIDFMTTLSGYVHLLLTGQRVLGVGDASGMFPIDPQTNSYDSHRVAIFRELAKEAGYSTDIETIFPHVCIAGEAAGALTAEGAALLDPSGQLQDGIPLCPPEGDGGTGMVATGSITPRTGNISAGTSIFAMVVLERALQARHEQIDIVTTPDGSPVAMVHANNGTSEINAWAGIFRDFAKAIGADIDTNTLYETLFAQAAAGDADAGELLSYGYLSGEHITEVAEGRPLLVRRPDSRFTLANLMRSHLYSTLGAVRLGMNILREQEQVTIDSLLGHGGFFKTPVVGQQIMASALDIPVAVTEQAGEGGPWGIAILAAFMVRAEKEMDLICYLRDHVFRERVLTTLAPQADETAGFERFMQLYSGGLELERMAGKL